MAEQTCFQHLFIYFLVDLGNVFEYQWFGLLLCIGRILEDLKRGEVGTREKETVNVLDQVNSTVVPLGLLEEVSLHSGLQVIPELLEVTGKHLYLQQDATHPTLLQCT